MRTFTLPILNPELLQKFTTPEAGRVRDALHGREGKNQMSDVPFAVCWNELRSEGVTPAEQSRHVDSWLLNLEVHKHCATVPQD
jgi:hypothetical protein